MEVWLILTIYGAGLVLLVLEAILPGIVLGIVGSGALIYGTYQGFQYHWALGVGQVGAAVVVIPALFFFAVNRMSLKASLTAESGAVGFAKNYSALLHQEGETLTELRPAGAVRIGEAKVDVVTSGEMIERGRRVRVVKVEGNRVIVREAS